MKSLEELQEELDEIIDAGFYYDPKELEEAINYEIGEAIGRKKATVNFVKKLLAKDFPVAEISEITYEWNIEGVWKHPNDDYPVTVKLGGSSSEPTVEVEFTENDFFGTKHSGVVSNELGEVNSENIYKSACTVTDLWGFYDSEWFVITPNGVVDSEGKALWERIE